MRSRLLVFLLVAGFAVACSDDTIHTNPVIRIKSMKETVEFLSSITPPRNYENVDSLQRSAAYISQRFKAYGLVPQHQQFNVSGKTYENVIASAGTTDGARIIIGGHYDVYGDMPGADDNASAVAALLEIARFAKRHEAELPCRVDFVAYTLEEPPYFDTTNMGSYVHAKYLHDNNIKVKGMICLEMIGFFTEQEDSQQYPLAPLSWIYPSTGNFIAVIGNFESFALARQVSRHLKATAVPVETLCAPPSLRGVDFSDHRNYWLFDYKAVMITDTAFYRNANYHQRSDTMDTLNFDKMAEVAKGICGMLTNAKK